MCGRLCEQSKGLNNVCRLAVFLTCFRLLTNRAPSMAPEWLSLSDVHNKGYRVMAVFTSGVLPKHHTSRKQLSLGAHFLKNKPSSSFCFSGFSFPAVLEAWRALQRKYSIPWKHPIVWLNQSLLSVHSLMGIWVISGLGYTK